MQNKSLTASLVAAPVSPPNALPVVLVVDDQLPNLVAMRGLLTRMAVHVVEVDSGPKALRKLLEIDVALILMDVRMPGMDGFDVMQVLQSEPTTANIPIILITADHADDKRLTRAYRGGAVDFLYKPVNPQVLVGKVRVFIELYKARQQLKQLSVEQQIILNTAAQGICGVSASGEVQFANPAAEKIANDILTGKNIFSLLYTENGAPLSAYRLNELTSAVQGKINLHNSRYSFHNADGYFAPVSLSASHVPLDGHSTFSSVIVFSDIGEHIKLENRLTKLARYDALTGLANRTLFFEALTHALARAKRQHAKVALFYIDLDHFKKVNDTLGHLAGDQLLTQFSQRLTSHCRETDSVARLGGDEFTVIIENAQNTESVTNIAEKLVRIINTPFQIGGRDIFTSMSIGIAIYPDVATSAEAITKCADTAMYEAKESGRNAFCFYNKSITKRIKTRVSLEQELRKAIKGAQFELYYQPKVSLINGVTTGFEALLRWHHPQRGVVCPGDFIAIAEDSGIIHEIGEWVFQNAFQQLEIWDKANLFDGLKLAINLSSRQLERPRFIEDLFRSTGEKQLQSIEIELTETAVMQNIEHASKLLSELDDRGVSIAIDDFGIGYSSFGKLKSLPIKTLKIDQSFVREIAHNKNDAAIVKAIVSMGQTLDINVIAEGVETLAHRDMLQLFHCPEAQGFHFARPGDAEQATQWLKSALH
ncbi:MAG: EAL domain-containing protein [Gammaproteobacteria bacterium]|nr:EAL domain-containing protein [Gammaproteobacteria bacterium]